MEDYLPRITVFWSVRHAGVPNCALRAWLCPHCSSAARSLGARVDSDDSGLQDFAQPPPTAHSVSVRLRGALASFVVECPTAGVDGSAEGRLWGKSCTFRSAKRVWLGSLGRRSAQERVPSAGSSTTSRRSCGRGGASDDQPQAARRIWEHTLSMDVLGGAPPSNLDGAGLGASPSQIGRAHV